MEKENHRRERRRAWVRRGQKGPRRIAGSIPHAGPEDDPPAEVEPFRVFVEPAFKVVRRFGPRTGSKGLHAPLRRWGSRR